MAEEIRFPRLGWSMEDGKFIGWLKQNGENVVEGEPLFEMEGEKAVQEIEAIGSGILFQVPSGPKPDTVVSVGELLGYLLAPGESLPNQPLSDPGPKPAETRQNESSSNSKTPTVASPSVRRMARELGVDLQNIVGTGRSGRVTREDVARLDEESKSTNTHPKATPRARRLAKQLGVDWKTLAGSGRLGRIREMDVLRYSSASPVAGKLFTSRRRAIAERLQLSRQRTIPVTLHTRCDATALVNFRSNLKSNNAPIVPSFNDILIQRIVAVLANHAAMRVRWNSDHTDLIGVDPADCHVGLAVDTPDGLLVPVVQGASQLSLDQIANESQRLVELARSGRLKKSHMDAGVITVTNLGSYGIDAFTPIINYPEIAILGVGAIRREAVWVDQTKIESRHMMTLSMTFDHAAVDGAPAAAFLRNLVEDMESFSP